MINLVICALAIPLRRSGTHTLIFYTLSTSSNVLLQGTTRSSEIALVEDNSNQAVSKDG